MVAWVAFCIFVDIHTYIILSHLLLQMELQPCNRWRMKVLGPVLLEDQLLCSTHGADMLVHAAFPSFSNIWLLYTVYPYKSSMSYDIYIYILCNSDQLLHHRFGSVGIAWNRNGMGTFFEWPAQVAHSFPCFPRLRCQRGWWRKRRCQAKWNIQTVTTPITLTVVTV